MWIADHAIWFGVFVDAGILLVILWRKGATLAALWRFVRGVKDD